MQEFLQQKLKDYMEFKTLLKNTSFLAGTRVVQFLTGLVRTKLIAYYLGTLGAGLIGQLTFLTQKMSQFTLLSMSEAVVKQISENKTSPRSVQLINSAYKSYFLLLALFMVFSCLSLHLLSEYLTIYVFGDIAYISYFYIGLFSFPVLILDSIPFSILKAFKDVKAISRARMLIVFINLIIVVPLILLFKLDGAIAFVPVSYLINFLVNFLYAQNLYFKKLKINFISIIKAEVNINFLRELLVFSSYGLSIGLFAILSEFLCRSIVVSRLGVDNIGLYSPIILMASLITGFILPTFSTYLYPRFCEVVKIEEISGLLNDGLRLGSLCVIPLFFIGIPFREFFITIIFSQEFIDSSKYLPYHFFGVLFYVWWYVLTLPLSPLGRIKQQGVFMFFFYSLDISVTYFFVQNFGLYGWMLKHIISPFVFFWIYFLYAKKYLAFKLERNNLLLMIYLFFNLTLLIILDFFIVDLFLIKYIIGLLLMFSFYILLKKQEKSFLLTKYKQVKNKIFK